MPFQNPPPHTTLKKPEIRQDSKGSGSPNVVTGDHSTVNITNNPPPKSSGPRFREKVEKVRITIGSNGAVYPIAMLRTSRQTPMVFGGGSKPIEVYAEGDLLLADVTVSSLDGSLIQVKHNEFAVSNSRWEKNYDDTALEIVDEAHRPVFQMIFVDDQHISINGIMLFSGQLVLAGASGMTIGPMGPRMMEAMRTFHLERIFKYPGLRYRGVRETP